MIFLIIVSVLVVLIFKIVLTILNKKDNLNVELTASKNSITLTNRETALNRTSELIEYTAIITGKTQDELKQVNLQSSLPVNMKNLDLEPEPPIKEGNKTIYKWKRFYRSYLSLDPVNTTYPFDNIDEVTLTVKDNKNNVVTKTVNLTITYDKILI